MTDGGMRFLLWIPSYSILVKTFHQWTVWYSFRNSRDRFSVYRCSNTTSINNTYATKRMMDVWYAVDGGDQATCEWAITFTSSMMRIISVRCKKKLQLDRHTRQLDVFLYHSGLNLVVRVWRDGDDPG